MGLFKYINIFIEQLTKYLRYIYFLMRSFFYISYMLCIRIFLDKPEHPLSPKPPTQQTPPPIPPEKPQTRDMAIWRTTARLTPPVKAERPPMERDPVTKLRIMHPIDYSGKNHILLNDHEYDSTEFYKIYGSFTTSRTPFEGRPPQFVSDITLEGQKKFQYFHAYPEPILLRKTQSQGMHFTTMFLSQSKMSEIIDKAKKYSDDDTNQP